MNEVFAQRFQELAVSRVRLPFHKTSMGTTIVPDGEWQGWATSVQSLLRAVFTETGEHYVNFCGAYNKCRGAAHQVRTLFHIFTSAKEDFEGGYVFNVELRVSGEVFGDFVTLARTALDEGHKDVAAVLACAALEDTLKRYAIANKLEVEGKTMADVINALKSASLVAGAQKAILDRMPAIRNMALHGEWAKIGEPEVAGVIAYVEQFLLTYFSN
jgi:hypothetical protein